MKMFSSASTLLILVATFAVATAHARQGATDPIPGTSNGTVNSGGGGTGGGGTGGGGTDSGGSSKINNAVISSTTTTTTTTTTILPPPPPPAPFVVQPLTFTPVSPINGVVPVCTGDYHIDPYYPTLSLMTVNVETSSVNAPDGTALYVDVTGTGGTLYPFTSNVISVSGGVGLCSYSVYVTPGTVITSVKISDASGHVIATGI